jgi:hypothetical protein
MAYFQTKNPTLGKFLRDLQKSWYILWPFGLFCGHLEYFSAILYILCLFDIFFHFDVVQRKIWQPWCCYIEGI